MLWYAIEHQCRQLFRLQASQVLRGVYVQEVGLYRWRFLKLWTAQQRAASGVWPESSYNAFPLHTQSLLLDVYGDRQLTYSRFVQAGECTLTPAASFFEFAGMPRAVWSVPQFGEGLLRLRVYNTPTDGSICHGWWGEVVLVRGPWGQPELHFTNAFQAFFSTELYQELSDAPLSRIAAPTAPRVPSTLLSTRNELGVEVDRMTSVYTTFTEWRASAHHRARCSWCKTKLPRKARKWCMCRMVLYCGKACQKKHWKAQIPLGPHRAECTAGGISSGG